MRLQQIFFCCNTTKLCFRVRMAKLMQQKLLRKKSVEIFKHLFFKMVVMNKNIVVPSVEVVLRWLPIYNNAACGVWWSDRVLPRSLLTLPIPGKSESNILAPWCSGYQYFTTSFNKAWTQVLRTFKTCSWHVRDSRWWGSPTMVPAGNMAKRLSSVNHTTKTIHQPFFWMKKSKPERKDGHDMVRMNVNINFF